MLDDPGLVRNFDHGGGGEDRGVALGAIRADIDRARGLKKIEAGGDPVGVTRAEAKAAPTSALLANILVGAGAAAVVGGVTWIVLTPTPGAPAAAPVPKTGTGEPIETNPTPTGAMINFGGSF